MLCPEQKEKPAILLYTVIDGDIKFILLQDYGSKIFYPFKFVARDTSFVSKFYGLELFFHKMLVIRETEYADVDGKRTYFPYCYKEESISDELATFAFTQTGRFVNPQGHETLIVKMDFSLGFDFDQLRKKFFLIRDYFKDEPYSTHWPESKRTDLIDYDPMPETPVLIDLMLHFLPLKPNGDTNNIVLDSCVYDAINYISSQFAPPPSSSPITQRFFQAANKAVAFLKGNGKHPDSDASSSSTESYFKKPTL